MPEEMYEVPGSRLRQLTDDITALREGLEATRNALHDACLMIGSTEGFRETFRRANALLDDNERTSE